MGLCLEHRRIMANAIKNMSEWHWTDCKFNTLHCDYLVIAAKLRTTE